MTLPTLPTADNAVIPGVYHGIPADEYHAAAGFSSSQIKYLSKMTPAHWRAKYLDGEIEEKFSDAMSLGTVVHSLVLEPEQAYKEFRPALNPNAHPEALKGKAAIVERMKAINADIEKPSEKLKLTGTIPELIERLEKVDPDAMFWDRLVAKAAEDPRIEVPLATWEQAQRMRDAVLSNPTAAKLLTNGTAESSIFAREPKTGLPLKVRPDYMRPDDRLMIDLKTTRSADPWKWGKDAGLLGYHLQQAMYCHVPSLLPDPFVFDAFVFVLIESEAPYLCECVELDEQTLDKGFKRYGHHLRQLSECLTSDDWPGYSAESEILSVSAPEWAA